MNMTKSLIISTLGILGLASACAVDSDMSSEEVFSGEDAVCSNEQGTNAAMASLAVAVGKELRRWKVTTDFQKGYYDGWQQILQLSPTGKARCAGGKCPNTEAILDWQKWIYSGKIKFPGGQTLVSDVFASRLLSRFDAQVVCESRPSNQPGNCAVEQHDLKFMSASPGSCDTNFYFRAYKAGTTQLLQYPGNLKYQLMFAGWDTSVTNSNPYLAFDVQGDDIQIDPTSGAIIGDPTASGSCPVVCSKISLTNISNSCCVCNGVQGKMQYTVAPPAGSKYSFSCR